MENNGSLKNNLRSVVSLVDKLRDIHLEEFITLPKIVTVGSQSSGKSSLIEQIVGMDFLPRGSGVVTRRPLQIRMVYQQDLQQSYARFEQLPQQKFTDFSKVKKAIEELTDKICGKNKNIVDKAIVMYVYSNNCPNLTIIDLPGLTRISLQSQAQNIHEVTRNMISKYMEQPNAIILCVIPANQDITNDQVLHMARKIDRFGQRTIGCITKIDIMDRGTDARALLSNKGQVPLELGYVGIKNRSQADINQNKSVQQSLDEEKMFFSKSPIYSSLSPSCVGTKALVEKLTKVLEKSITNYLPILLEKIREKKTALSHVIKQYGRPLPKTIQQKQSLIWQLCNEFINNYQKALRGVPCLLKCADRVQKVSFHINQQLKDFLIEQTNEAFDEYLEDKKINFALRKFDTINQLGFPSMNSFLYLINPLLNDLKHPMQNSLAHLCDNMQHLSDLISSEIAHEYIEFRQFLNGKTQQIINEFRRQCNYYLNCILQTQVKGVNYQKLTFDRSQVDQKKMTDLERQNPLIPVLRSCIKRYYHNSVKNMRQLIPKNFYYLLLIEAVKKIQFQVFQSCMTSEKQIQKWLELSTFSKQQRLRNQRQYEIIEKAEQFILTHSGFVSRSSMIGSMGGGKKFKKKRQERQKEIQVVVLRQKQKKKQKEQAKMAKIAHEIKQQEDKAKAELQKQEKLKQDKTKKLFGLSKQQKHSQESTQKARSKPKQPQPQTQQKTNKFAQLFGGGFWGGTESKPSQSGQKSDRAKEQSQQSTQQSSNRKPIFPDDKKQQFNETYNRQMGKTTDKAVDQMFKNEKFQKQSKKAVEKGSSAAFQKQFGVSEETGNKMGKGMGWIWGQDATQNYVKEETKKNARDKTQIK